MTGRIRKIIHIDMDAFYASVEQRDFPQYRDKPVIVGGFPQSRGVVAACSYAARRFGIHSAMPASQAYRQCPNAIFVRPRFEVYRQVSQQIQEIFQGYTDVVEPLSLDEAYLDVTAASACNGSATLMAKKIKNHIRLATGLTASAGISYNKFLAKIASDLDKPDGFHVILPEDGAAFIERLPIGKFFGIGTATETKMHALGVFTGADLKSWPVEKLQQIFGKMGTYFYEVARGIDKRPVLAHRKRKSIGSETTFTQDLQDIRSILSKLKALAKAVALELNSKHLAGRTLSIKVKYDNFELITRRITLTCPITCFDEMLPLLPKLLEKTEAGQRKVRLLGVTVSNIDHSFHHERDAQLTLF